MNIDFKPFILVIRGAKSASRVRGVSQVIKDTMVEGHAISLRRSKRVLECSSIHYEEEEEKKEEEKVMLSLT